MPHNETPHPNFFQENNVANNSSASQKTPDKRFSSQLQRQLNEISCAEAAVQEPTKPQRSFTENDFDFVSIKLLLKNYLE